MLHALPGCQFNLRRSQFVNNLFARVSRYLIISRLPIHTQTIQSSLKIRTFPKRTLWGSIWGSNY